MGFLLSEPQLSAKKCWLEAEGMQKVELGVIGNEECRQIVGVTLNKIHSGLNSRNPSCTDLGVN